MKEYLKPCAYNPSEQYLDDCDGVPFEERACELAVRGEVNPCGVAVAKASPNRAIESRVLDPKRSDLAMGRVKRV